MIRNPHRGRLGVLALLLGLAGTAAAAAPAPPTLSVEQALQRVLRRHPRLAAAELALSAGRTRVEQAGRRPNPLLELDWENLAGSGDLAGTGHSELSLGLTQTFDLSGRRGRQVELARLEADRLDLEGRTVLLDLVERTRRTHLETWVAQEAVALARQRLDLAVELVAEMERRVNAGASSPVDLSRARLQQAAESLALTEARTAWTAAARELALLWGARSIDFERVQGPGPALRPTTAPPPLDPARSPELGADRLELDRLQARGRLAAAIGRPDLDLTIGVRRLQETGDAALLLGAGLPLPLFDRNGDEQAALREDLHGARRLAEARELEIRVELDRCHDELTAAAATLAVLREQVLPAADAARRDTETGHRRGLFSLTDLLETRRTEFELRAAEIAAVRRGHLARIRSDRLTGTLPDSVSPADPEEIR